MTTGDLRLQYPLYLKKSLCVNRYIDISKPFEHVDVKDLDVSFYTFLHMHMKLVQLERPERKDVRAMLLFKKMMYSKDCIDLYVAFLKRSNIDTSLLRCIHVMYKDYYIQDVSLEDVTSSKVMKRLMIQMKCLTYVYLHKIFLHPHFIKTKTLHDLKFFIHKNISCICLEDGYAMTQMDKKLLFKFQIPLIKSTSFEKVKSLHIDLDLKKVRCFEETTVSNTHLTTCFKHIVMYHCAQASNVLNQIHYHDMTYVGLDIHTTDIELSFFKSTLKNHLKTHHVFLLPPLNETNTSTYVDFFNDLNPLMQVSMCMRGGFRIDDFFQSYSHFKSLLKNKDVMKRICLIIDTDELSLHLNQIKKSQKIDLIIIDVDGLMFDIFDEENNQIMSKFRFKTHYLDVFKEMHTHLRIQGIPHFIYSKHLLNKDIYKMLKCVGFKEFLIEETLS